MLQNRTPQQSYLVSSPPQKKYLFSLTPEQNYLLDALPEADLARLTPQLELVPLALGTILYEAGGEIPYVYFPLDAIVSKIYITKEGASAEMAVIGKEGMVGTSLLMGGTNTPNRTIVTSAGHAYRLKSNLLKDEFYRAGELQHLLLRFIQVLLTQTSQTAVCNRHHSVEQQLCRWLLLTLDRLNTNELVMTQELIASMLGVRREGVTEAAVKLKKAGLIDYSRGKITILDRAKLEKMVCECYEVVKIELERLVPCQLAR